MRASGGGCQSKYRWEDENTTWDNAISTRADTAIWIKLMLNQTNLIRSTRWMNSSHAMNNIRVFFGLLFPWRKWTSISTIAIVSMAMLLKQCDVISNFFWKSEAKKKWNNFKDSILLLSLLFPHSTNYITISFSSNANESISVVSETTDIT